MFKFAFLPDPEFRDEIDFLMEGPNVKHMFQTFNSIVGSNSVDWKFDGDTWYTAPVFTRAGEVGSYAIFTY